MYPEPERQAIATPDAVDAFIGRWQNTGGTERANYQLFLTELCALLGLPQPDPASETNADNAYVFERRVDIKKPDGSVNRGFVDLYKRGSFVLEAKQTGKTLGTTGWDKAMLAAQNQADQYVRALPADEGRPPFIVVTDVGRSLELYAEFSRSGGTYVPFPDPGHHRIALEDLRKPDIQHRLYNLWQDPDSLDLSKQAARVTREVSAKLAALAKLLEQSGHPVEQVAHFLKRCLFTMFSEDVELIPYNSFTHLLERLQKTPEHFADSMRSLWSTMNDGGFEGQIMAKVQRFNGGLFKDINPIALNAEQIGLLIEAARADWRYVEPAIFGTLLERALDPRERHKLGAHYTPRAYVERLVMPTLIEPLRDEWQTVQVAAEAWLQQNKEDKALTELRNFHHKLCNTRVLDPACGSGNFLYVALEHLKRLEGEVLNLIRDLSDGQQTFDTQGLTVDPHQFLGLEINPRAAAIAEIVLWIGYLQWHYRINGKLDLPEPILRDFHNIECRDALIDYDSREEMLGEDGKPKTIWDGISYKKSPITGELIPDDTQRIPVYHFNNPRKAEWPEADYIVGNPPFIGEKRMRDALGDGYVEAVRKTYAELPACDFVMYWWHKAAIAVCTKNTLQFGFITTNSISQSRNRAVSETHLAKGLCITFAVPDHPWVDASIGASVRISMTVGSGCGASTGSLLTILTEKETGSETKDVTFKSETGEIYCNLSVGAPLLLARPLKSNESMVYQGIKLVGDGFLVTPDERREWIASNKEWGKYLPELVAGSDLTKRREKRFCIDFFGMTSEKAFEAFSPAYQRILDKVKPMRDTNPMKSRRENWWIHGAPASGKRVAVKGIGRYIATSEVSKHRFFVFVDEPTTIADGSLAVVASSYASILGILTSRVHTYWALSQGGKLESRPRWQNGPCFLNFPFPELTEAQSQTIGTLAEKIDAHRKRQQTEHDKLTLTGMYNVLEKLRAEEPLTDKDKAIHEQGLVSVLRELHDELDAAVFEAYGWSDLGEVLVGRPGATTPLPDKPAEQAEAEEELLCRLVALNHQRAAEEAQGHIRWLRPDYQAPAATQTSADLSSGDGTEQTEQADDKPQTTAKQAWPKTMPEQVRAVQQLLAIGPQTQQALAEQFKRKPEKSIAQVLGALEVLGQASCSGELWQLG